MASGSTISTLLSTIPLHGKCHFCTCAISQDNDNFFFSFKCPVCPKRLHKVQNFKEHLLKHTGPENVKTKVCRYCRTLVPQVEFVSHLNNYHPEKEKFICRACGASFMSQKNLDYHAEKHIPRAEWAFKCSVCDQAYPSEQRFEMLCCSYRSSLLKLAPHLEASG